MSRTSVCCCTFICPTPCLWFVLTVRRDASCLGEGRVGYGAGSDSDSDWSDAELDDVAAIKFRAVTPPWQRVPDRQPMSLTLQQRTAAAALGEPLEPPVLANWAEGLGGLGSCWDDDDDTAAKLQEVRRCRPQQSKQQGAYLFCSLHALSVSQRLLEHLPLCVCLSNCAAVETPAHHPQAGARSSVPVSRRGRSLSRPPRLLGSSWH